MSSFSVTTVATSPIEGQKTGTSGLRKQTRQFMQPHYLNNWVQSLFNVLGENLQGATMVLGGDGRYFNKEAVQIIIKMAAANGVGKLLIGQNGILSTPALSAIVRARKALGGIIMTASHNPGGPDNDWGIKYNASNGGPAPESLTDKIYEQTVQISEYKLADLPEIDLSTIAQHSFGQFQVEIIDSVADYLALFRTIFDFDDLRNFVRTSGVKLLFDSMHGVTGAYTTRIFVDELGFPSDSLINNIPSPDFNGGHPDPNLAYAEELVSRMLNITDEQAASAPDLGVASDGDGDRNMILGKQFFVTPSDSVAIIAAYAARAIPYFRNTGVKGVARSMPTSTALDRVAKKLGVEFFEVPTGWKYFGNLMDAGRLSICGEESFGTGSDHIREKDGIWAVLAWLSILSYCTKQNNNQLVSVRQIVTDHWKEFGRSFYTRYDYEEVDTGAANNVMNYLVSQFSTLPNQQFDGYTVSHCDEFEYRDPIDGSVASKQGIRIMFTDGSRAVFRLSGTGSKGATIRMYVEQYESAADKLEGDAKERVRAIADVALRISKLAALTGRHAPTVIT